ncbi:hypothetical protein ABHA30_00075, partial [Enterococcus faecium]
LVDPRIRVSEGSRG